MAPSLARLPGGRCLAAAAPSHPCVRGLTSLSLSGAVFSWPKISLGAASFRLGSAPPAADPPLCSPVRPRLARHRLLSPAPLGSASAALCLAQRPCARRLAQAPVLCAKRSPGKYPGWRDAGSAPVTSCQMSDVGEYRCFVGSLSWSTTEVELKDAFGKFGRLTEAKVVLDKFSGRSRGFGFVTFDDKKAMEEAIEAMNGMDLDGRNITVERAQPQSSGRDRDGDRDYSRGGGERDRYRGDYGRGRDRGRDFGGGRGGGGGGDCFKCGKPGHFARECPSGDGGRDDRYGGRDDRYGGRDDRYGGGDDRYSSRDDKYGGSNGSSRYGPDRGGDRYSGSRDGGSRDGGSRNGGGGDRYNRDRSGPYERPSRGGYRS